VKSGQRSCKRKQEMCVDFVVLEDCLAFLKKHQIHGIYIDGQRDQQQYFIIKFSDKIAVSKHSFYKLMFRYSDPEDNFNRNRIKGVICYLFFCTISFYCLSLEIAAGAKLFHIVVDSDETAKKILQKANLNRRVTLIPENKIYLKNHDDIQKKIQILSRDQIETTKINLAINLIKFDAKFMHSMIYVFGNSIICPDTISAQKAALNERQNGHVRMRAITVLGDDFNPSGIVTGGSRPLQDSVLDKICDLRRKKFEFYENLINFRKVEIESHYYIKIADTKRIILLKLRNEIIKLKHREEECLTLKKNNKALFSRKDIQTYA
jgi:structural maintenance of chromosome 2